MKTFDVIVIGAGSGGVRFARLAAELGVKVAIIENRYYGGTCVNVGCVPKKLYVYASSYAQQFVEARGFGWSVGEASFDWRHLVTEKQSEIRRLNDIYESLLTKAGVKQFWGSASFVDKNTIKVNDDLLSAKRVLIATGSWPVKPAINGAELMLTSNEFFDLEKLPKRCLVQGSGYIGVEFAGILSGLGCEVELVYRSDLPLKSFDHEVRSFLAEQMLEKGISLRSNTVIHSIQRSDADTQSFSVKFGDDSGAVGQYDAVIAATGRRPMIDGLNLAEVGVELAPNQAVKVDKQFKTSVEGIYAIGDVIDRVALTPVAIGEAMFLLRHFYGALGNKTALPHEADMDYHLIPTAVFSQPNVGTVGLTEEQAEKQEPVDIYTSNFRAMKHTLSGLNERSFCKLIISQTTGKVLGLHIVGPDAGEITQGFAVAMKAGATLADFHSTVGIHPTFAEELVTMRVKRKG